jgi:hypothetical protein
MAVLLLLFAWPKTTSSSDNKVPTVAPAVATFTATPEGFQVTTAPALLPTTPEQPTVIAQSKNPAIPLPPGFSPAAMSPDNPEAMKERFTSLREASRAVDSSTVEIGNARQTIVFILDKSGSMYETVSGTRRIDFATKELRERIASLDSRTQFNIVLFAEKTILFQSQPVFATAENKLNAVRFIQRDDTCGGETDFPAGYQAALTQRPNAILFLTDGDLNLNDQELVPVIRILREKNRCNPALNILAFYARPESNADKVLARLCADNRGELHYWKPGKSRHLALNERKASSVETDVQTVP